MEGGGDGEKDGEGDGEGDGDEEEDGGEEGDGRGDGEGDGDRVTADCSAVGTPRLPTPYHPPSASVDSIVK